jgi:APA family basic amino acid/polyamine antiporter
MAAVALTFAEYALRLGGNAGAGSTALAIAALVLVTAVNYAGVKPGSRLLNAFVLLKIAALAALIGAGLLVGGSPGEAVRAQAAAVPAGSLAVAFGWALVPVLFSYGGWQLTNFVAEEIKNPTRTLPIALLLGSAIVVAIYLAVNVVYLAALGHGGLAATLTPAADTARRLMGGAGDRFIAASIAISTFGFLDMAVLSAARVYYAMAADGYLMPAMKQLHPRYRTPTLALLVQMAWAIALLLTGTYGQLLDYVVFADWIFFGLSVSTVFVFRRRVPVAGRPAGTFFASGYPIVPALFVAVSVAVVLSVVWASPGRSAAGAALLALGVPVFWYYSRRPVAS